MDGTDHPGSALQAMDRNMNRSAMAVVMMFWSSVHVMTSIADVPESAQGVRVDQPAPFPVVGTDRVSDNRHDRDERTGTTVNVPGPGIDALNSCNPDVVFSGGELRTAFDAVPDGGTLGFSDDHVFPDKASARLNWQGADATKRICGIKRADGTKPRLAAPSGSKWVFGGFRDLVIDGLAIEGIGVLISGTGGGVSFRELRLDRVEFGQVGGRCLFVSYGPSAIGPVVERPGATGDDPAATGYVTITNSSMRDCTGPGNHTHSMYLSRRGCVFRADRVTVEAIDQLEAFRSLCRVNVVTRSHFTNVVRETDGRFRRARGGHLDHYGGTPVDLPSCGAYILRGNRFDVHSDGGTVAAIGIRSRLSMTACDMPNNYSANLWTKVPWPEVRAEIGNPYIFPVIVESNTFAFHGPVSDNERVIAAWGTYPRRHAAEMKSSGNPDYLAVPDGWRERNVVFWKDNEVLGDWAKIHELGLRQGVADTSAPDAWAPGAIPPVPFVETDVELPRTCNELRAILTGWWDEPGNHDGFPPCP